MKLGQKAGTTCSHTAKKSCSRHSSWTDQMHHSWCLTKSGEIPESLITNWKKPFLNAYIAFCYILKGEKNPPFFSSLISP